MQNKTNCHALVSRFFRNLCTCLLPNLFYFRLKTKAVISNLHFRVYLAKLELRCTPFTQNFIVYSTLIYQGNTSGDGAVGKDI